jgi:hypothetical protein
MKECRTDNRTSESDSISDAHDVNPTSDRKPRRLAKIADAFFRWKTLSGLLIVAGAGAVTAAFAADFVGIGHQAGLGTKQIVLAVAGLAALSSGCALAVPWVRTHFERSGSRLVANWRNSDAATGTGSRQEAILSVVLISLAALVWPGTLGNVVSLDWKVGNVRPAAYGLQVVLLLLALASILGRRRVGYVWARLFPTHKELVFACIAVAASVALTLLALELGLRAIGKPFAEDWEPQEYARAQFDPEIGWTYRPNQSSWVNFVSGQPPVLVYHNEIGARVRSEGIHFDRTVPTLILVGCSYTFGFGLSYDETFAGYLESIPSFPLQVVNLGVEGYGTDQSMLMLKRYFDSFDTKVVVFTYMEGQNDRNLTYDRRILYPSARFVGTKPLFGVDREGTLYLKRRPMLYKDLSYGRVWAYVQTAWQRWGPIPTHDLTRALVQEMNDYVEARGATFIVVDWVFDVSETEGETSVFEGMRIHLMDTRDEAPPGWMVWNSPWMLPNDSHPSAKGTLRVAQLIRNELIDLGLISQDVGAVKR